MKIGLYGGTFDPIHCGHLIIAEFVRTELSLERIIFIPAGTPPHKSLQTSAALRWAMVKIAIAGHPFFEASNYEVQSVGACYTIDTVRHLKSEFGLDREQLFLIIGSDNFVDFSKWKEPEKIMEQSQIVIFPRSRRDWMNAPQEFKRKAIYLRNAPLLEISSTQIRQYIHQGRSIKYLVPAAVERFIASKKLYR